MLPVLCMFQFGKSNDESDEDVVGMPETIPIKIARRVAKVASKVLPFIAKTGVVDGDGADLLQDTGSATEKQEKASLQYSN